MEIQFPKLCPRISPNTESDWFSSQFLHLEVVLQVAANSWQVVHALNPHLARVQPWSSTFSSTLSPTRSPPGKYLMMIINISAGWKTNFAHLTLSWKLTYKCITAKRHIKELQKQKISAHFGFSALTLFSSCNHFQYYLFQVVPWSDPWMRRKFQVISMSRARKVSARQEIKNLNYLDHHQHKCSRLQMSSLPSSASSSSKWSSKDTWEQE